MRCELENNLMLYGEVVKMITKHDTEAYAQKAQDKYIEHLDLFKHLIDE